MSKLNDLTGQVFGQWTVEDRAPNRGRYIYWNCLCTCGRISSIRSSSLVVGLSKSCRKCVPGRLKQTSITHGLSEHPAYGKWKMIRQRCYSTKHKRFRDYGAKGIIMCDSWKDSHIEFIGWLESNHWSPGEHVHRRHPLLGYTPNNCEVLSIEAHARLHA